MAFGAQLTPLEFDEIWHEGVCTCFTEKSKILAPWLNWFARSATWKLRVNPKNGQIWLKHDISYEL